MMIRIASQPWLLMDQKLHAYVYRNDIGSIEFCEGGDWEKSGNGHG